MHQETKSVSANDVEKFGVIVLLVLYSLTIICQNVGD
jgi:hypothetical protein